MFLVVDEKRDEFNVASVILKAVSPRVNRGRRRHAGSGFGRLPPAQSSHASQRISMKRILIIEDDQRIARALKIRFESKGYETAIASNAILGANLALQAHPDL